MRRLLRIRIYGSTLAALCLMAAAPAVLSAQVGPSDVALFKSAFQSTDYDVNHTAPKAVDGNTDGNFSNHSVAVTSDTPAPWWYVDLGGDYDISSITLWGRTDCCANRLANFWLSVLASGTPTVESNTAPTVWQVFTPNVVSATTAYTMPSGTIGRFVKVQFTQHQYLEIAEVDVEGTLAVTATPEPSSLALLATGLAGVFYRTRRRRRA